MKKHSSGKRLSAGILSFVMALGAVHTSAAAAGVPETFTGTSEVSFGSTKAYDVTAQVSVLDGKITDVELSHNAGASGHDSSVGFADSAMAMAEGFRNLSASDRQAIEAVDAVSGATVTSEAFRAAVLDALDLNKPVDLTFGSADTPLEAGTYRVPVFLRNAKDHNKASNAAGAFPAMAALTVSEDGSAVLESAIQTVTIGPISDMAYDIQYYKEDNFTSPLFPVNVLETAVKPQSMPGGGKEVPTRISLTIPDNHFDGVYMRFTVDAMGPGYPDAWLRIDYANAKVPGTAQHFQGTAKVNQFGKYTIHNEVTVVDGVISGMDITADSFISETHKPTNLMKIDQTTNALKNAWNGMAPTQENAEKIFKVIMKTSAPDEVIDAVSGATYTAKAIRDSVMDAFGLEYQDEIINVPQSVEPGVYQVQASLYSDVVWHSLVENVKTGATLTVREDGTMSLDLETRSGTEKEPLYLLGFNGVYRNNNRADSLTLDGCTAVMGLSSNDYEDEFFQKGTQVVNHLTIPLLGDLNKIYSANAYLYVPAMKRLNGEASGVYFTNGHFNVDIFAKIYWDTMVKIGDVPEPPVSQHFTDVPEDVYYSKAVNWAVSEAITSGMDDTRFGPDRTCTRAQIIKFLWNAAQRPEPSSTVNPFTDVSENSYYYKAVLWAVEQGITHGITETSFCPDAPCTRAQAVTFLWNAGGRPGAAEAQNPFGDVSRGSYYYDAVLWAVENRITNGLNSQVFGSDDPCTRAQIVTFLWNQAGRP